MINNTNLQRMDRLRAKSLNNQFINHVTQGMNCSPFEAEALLDCVYDVFGPLFDSSQCPHPGQVQINVVADSVPSNTPLEQAKLVLVTLTLDGGEEDLKVRQEGGVVAVRRLRMTRMAMEAFEQGGLLTLEDLAFRLLNCGLRTLVADLAALRKKKCSIPLRSSVKDIGRTVTHRRQIVTRWLHGDEYSEIAKKTYHSVNAVARYVDKFKRCVALFNENFDVNTIAFLVHLSPSLVLQLHTIYTDIEPIEYRRQELEGFLKKNNNQQGD